MATSRKVAKRLRQVLGVTRVGVQVIGVDVPHAHVQLIPFDDVRQYHKQADMLAEPDHSALAAMAKKLAI